LIPRTQTSIQQASNRLQASKEHGSPYTYISKLQMQKNPNAFVKRKKPTITTTTTTK
jgi:hypothetical protein